MNTSTTPKSQNKTISKPNGSTATEHSDPAAAAPPATTTPTTTTASEKKPVTVMIPESLHRKVKVLAELSGTSLSDLVETELKALVKNRLPALLAGLDAGE